MAPVSASSTATAEAGMSSTHCRTEAPTGCSPRMPVTAAAWTATLRTLRAAADAASLTAAKGAAQTRLRAAVRWALSSRAASASSCSRRILLWYTSMESTGMKRHTCCQSACAWNSLCRSLLTPCTVSSVRWRTAFSNMRREAGEAESSFR